MEKSKRKKILTQRPRWPMKAFILAIGIVTTVIHVFAFRMAQMDTEFPIILVMLMLLIDSALLWWGYIFTTQTHVTIYDDGIELVRGGARLFVSWDNVSHLGVKGFGRNERRGIFLHEKVKPEVKGMIEKLVFGWETDFIALGRYVHLPRYLNPFKREVNTEKLLETEFGQALYEYAPHLFDDYGDSKPKKRLEDGYDEREDYWYEEEMMQDEQNE